MSKITKFFIFYVFPPKIIFTALILADKQLFSSAIKFNLEFILSRCSINKFFCKLVIVKTFSSNIIAYMQEIKKLGIYSKTSLFL